MKNYGRLGVMTQESSKDKYHWICPEPFTNIFSSPYGWWKPCCVINDSVFYDESDLFYTTKDYTHDEFYNSAFMKRLRNAMKNGGDDDWLNKVCEACRVTEGNGSKSFREQYVEKFWDEENGFFKHLKDDLIDIIDNDKQPSFYHSMEHSAVGGNVCNLACSMCDGQTSSTYRKEEIELGEKYINSRQDGKPSHGQSHIVKPIIKELPDISKVRELKLTGGESLMIKQNWDLISQMEENTTLRIITNGTITIKDLSVFEKFKRVTWNISIEGPKEINEYIRYPSKWSTIQKNIKIMNEIPNAQTFYVSTVGALNIHHLLEVDSTPVKDHVAQSLIMNNEFSLNSIPPDIKEYYYDKLWSSKTNNHEMLEALTRYLDNSEFNEFHMWAMLSKIKKRDKLRGTNLLSVLPEWTKYYESCSG